MSNSSECFDVAIQDVEELVEFYDLLNQDNKKDPEVLKRSALIMAMTAWETYVEDRLRELLKTHLRILGGSRVGAFIESKIEQDLKYFHNPDSRKTKRIFEGLIGCDITESWCWNTFDASKSRETLNRYIKLRGDIVHRSIIDKQESHPVKKDDVVKCVRFLKELVRSMDDFLIDY